VENGIPSLLLPELNVSLREGHEPIKIYYYKEEQYDWTRDPKGLEFAYHRYRRWETWREVEKMLKPGMAALDVGCGTGLITRGFWKRFQRVVALDLNRWALSQMDGKPYVFKIQDGSVDLVVATEVIEHLEEPGTAANEIYRVCKKGGHVVGTVPSTSPIWKWRKYLSLTCGGGEPFHHNYTRDEIVKLWEAAGFNIEVRSSCLGLNWLWTLGKM
jgi:ubiquinone/menaquinone biosynthesis C-methylase UbiE